MSEVQDRVPVADDLRDELAAKEALIAAQREQIMSLEGKNEALQSALINHAHEIELLKRRLLGPRSERSGIDDTQMSLDELLAGAAELQRELDALNAAGGSAGGDTPNDEPKAKDKPKPKGRRDLALSSLPQVVVDIEDPELAAKGKLIDYEISRQLGYQRGGFYVIVKRTAKYELPTAESTTVLSAPSPKSVLSRGMLHTSLIGWLIVQKFGLGVPHYRLEQQLEAEGTPLSRSVMSRNVEEVGNVLGATVVHAMLEHARTMCGVLSTDATGAAIQPGPRDGGPKRACDKGHFFTIVADRDHVLFEFTSEHTSVVVARLFHGFKGYLQTDASSVYDVLDHGPLPLDDDPGVTLVGCWAHYPEPRVITPGGAKLPQGAVVAWSILLINAAPSAATARRRGAARELAELRNRRAPLLFARRVGGARHDLGPFDPHALSRAIDSVVADFCGSGAPAPDNRRLRIMSLMRRSG